MLEQGLGPTRMAREMAANRQGTATGKNATCRIAATFAFSATAAQKPRWRWATSSPLAASFVDASYSVSPASRPFSVVRAPRPSCELVPITLPGPNAACPLIIDALPPGVLTAGGAGHGSCADGLGAAHRHVHGLRPASNPLRRGVTRQGARPQPDEALLSQREEVYSWSSL